MLPGYTFWIQIWQVHDISGHKCGSTGARHQRCPIDHPGMSFPLFSLMYVFIPVSDIWMCTDCSVYALVWTTTWCGGLYSSIWTDRESRWISNTKNSDLFFNFFVYGKLLFWLSPGNTGVAVMLYDPRRSNFSRIERESGVKFEHIAAPQPADIAKAAGLEAVETITEVSDR